MGAQPVSQCLQLVSQKQVLLINQNAKDALANVSKAGNYH